MPKRFDHAVIAVRDLDAATRQFQHLGFAAQPGGRHTGRGTHNALIRFGLDYVELLAVYDEAEARAFHGGKPTLLDYLHGKEAALVSYALATTTIEQDAERFLGRGTTPPEPDVMQRRRPDGNLLTWRTLAPDGNLWGQVWPFLIQWDTPDAQRLQIDLPDTQPNGTIGWTRVAVATRNLENALAIYRDQLGLELIEQSAHRATLRVWNGTIELLAANNDELVQQILSEKEEGPFALTFAVKDLAQTHAFLEQRRIQFQQESTNMLSLAQNETLGVRINLVG